MSNNQTLSWILLSVAIATQKEATDMNGISMVADGINHTIPTQRELRNAIDTLLKLKLIERNGKKFELSPQGKAEYEKASNSKRALFDIWQELEIRINNYA